MPDHNIGCSSSNNGYSGGNYSDSYDSDPDGYITPPNEDNSAGGPNFDEDFSEYMWMENEEEFDKQEMQRLEEEALMEQCIEAMLQDELEAQQTGGDSSESSKDLCNALSTLEVSSDQKVSVEKSTLNPLAAEFVPSVVPPTST
uniref:Putative polya-binding protein n=1 Tax=Psorophora albipes TaxID=869069 RepID=T1DJ01_9DIPT